MIATMTICLEATRLCRIAAVLGSRERCGEWCCPFWEPGGAALDGRCAVERLNLDGRLEVAAWLLGVRERLERAQTVAERERALSELYALLDKGDLHGG
jgi:hypothetical protein